jgi:hypothetical protein
VKCHDILAYTLPPFVMFGDNVPSPQECRVLFEWHLSYRNVVKDTVTSSLIDRIFDLIGHRNVLSNNKMDKKIFFPFLKKVQTKYNES